MVSTKHCCWGTCNSDSRYPEKLHKSLKEMVKLGMKIFIPFPKPSQGIERCERWINACSRENFTVDLITRKTYICALHWPGERGPTDEFPDPLKANFTACEVLKASCPKRKAPQPRILVDKRARKDNPDSLFPSIATEDLSKAENVNLEAQDADDQVPGSDEDGNNKATQTDFTRHELSRKIETIILKNEMKGMSSEDCVKVVNKLSYEVVAKDSTQMKQFVGLTTPQFEVLYDFLNDVSPLDNITYWSDAEKGNPVKASQPSVNRENVWSSKEKLFICLLRLKSGFTIQTLAFLLSTPGKQIRETSIRNIFTMFIQLMYKIFRDMEYVMFPSKEFLKRYHPKVFKSMPKVRCSVDCTEFRVQTSRNFARQGNTFSTYKHANTLKCLIAVTPNGGACFVSDLFEGDTSDVEIF